MKKRAFLLIDVQKNMFDPPGVVGANELFPRWQGLLQEARTNGDVVIHVQHCGDERWDDAPGKDGWQIHPAVAPHPGEPPDDARHPRPEDVMLAAAVQPGDGEHPVDQDPGSNMQAHRGEYNIMGV